MRITVVRALPGLGDIICAVPALRALRDHDVTYVGLPPTRALVERFGHVRRFVAFPGFPGLPDVPLDAARTLAFLAEQHRAPADLALQLHGSGVASRAFTELLGARRTAGFVPAGAPRPGEDWLTWIEDEPEVRRPLRLLAHLGLPTDGEELEFPIADAEERAADALALPRPYAVVHAGAALPDRRWPAERFATVADALADRGLTPVLTGTPAEAGTVATVRAGMRAPHELLVGRTPLGVLAAVVRDARLVVVNDTGVSHLAAAVGTPSVVVFPVTDPARWAPVDRVRHRPLRGMVPVADVLGEVEALLAAAPSAAEASAGRAAAV